MLHAYESTTEEREFFTEKQNTVPKPWKLELKPLKYKSSIVITLLLSIISIAFITAAILTQNDFFGYFGAVVFIFSVGGVVFWYSLSLEVSLKNSESGDELMEFSGFYSMKQGKEKNFGRNVLGETFEDMTVGGRRQLMDNIHEEDFYTLGDKTYI